MSSPPFAGGKDQFDVIVESYGDKALQLVARKCDPHHCRRQPLHATDGKTTEPGFVAHPASFGTVTHLMAFY